MLGLHPHPSEGKAVSTGFGVSEDGSKVLCCYNIANDCKGYITLAECFTFPEDKGPSNVCKPCGDLDMQRYYAEHYG